MMAAAKPGRVIDMHERATAAGLPAADLTAILGGNALTLLSLR